ncbi:hypothetical protein NFHSH190041_28880 [Shewanella sp. NFH-SH190041]|uniref:DUF1501 domain-containing protein n=1 Tax=Shewanella sp. NFH-SH190041 TaxID=2950245 RepID=UPI0021C354B8|nr:DUF1501 domain-containing protein [Shewanella sp. NFH-SH190041]BDM65436.1 hypothetical protein NFHSH190041_28880 [Shewanella sp. NFH-SH190041]
MKRRHFLKLTATSIAAATTTSISALLGSPQALAATNDYKALVCVFLYGGMDCHDTVIPYDNENYNRWAQIRSAMLNQYATPRSQANLSPISTPSRFGSRQFALPPEMSGLHNLYQTGKAAIVGNLGPLLEPVTAAQIRNETAKLPARLFSHNDQQSTWMSGHTEGAQYGWAGQTQDALINAGISQRNIFSAISMSSGELLITGQQTTPYHLIGGKAQQPVLLQSGISGAPNPNQVYLGTDAVSVAGLPENLSNYFFTQDQYANLLQADFATLQHNALQANVLFNQAVDVRKVTAAFPNHRLGNQLKRVFATINARDTLVANRQVFVVSLGGFDTHSEQPQTLPALQSMLDTGISAFYTALEDAGLSEQVTLFTASDFGRTLAFNGDGTDHGWGGHHFVVGGAVKGATIYGDIPVSEFDHAQDIGGGRLVPTSAIDQYAADFATWMGLNDTQILQLFPNLTNFNGRLGFMR